MAPTKPTGSSANPIDLTARPSTTTPTPTVTPTSTTPVVTTTTTGGGVISGRITKSKSTKSTPTKPKSTPSKTKKTPSKAATDTPNTPKRGKASGPSCLPCRRAKARCDRVVACERCVKAGKECAGSGGGEGEGVDGGAAGGKPGKACERCRKMKAACVRREIDTCDDLPG
ncbi:uncharacterized protein B0H64DRAFT_447153 [Chaetomium fimeti]|uniref:Zn(2)-C6 fungal-type domain-containing protein n=1 Tax=Chaetomium fimeti TaxID=1854472 RepID=A0AAE0H5V6_9PEZI|nr:hypothetical protein B0H64DRAFT_447153 [Chaetomium fimeti]